MRNKLLSLTAVLFSCGDFDPNDPMQEVASATITQNQLNLGPLRASTLRCMAPCTVFVRAVVGRDDYPNQLAACGPSEETLSGAPSAAKQAVAQCLAALDARVDTENARILQQGSPLTALYRWSFGDPNGLHNQLTGFNAAHTYEQPGTYTVELSVTNEAGEQGQTQATIQVQPNTRPALYVDAVSGNDAASGSQSQPIRTLAQAKSRLSSLASGQTNGVSIKLKRGQTFPLASPINAGNLPGLRIDTWGTGSRPRVRADSGFLSGNLTNVLIRDLAIEATGAHTTWFSQATTDVSVLRTTFVGSSSVFESPGIQRRLFVANSEAQEVRRYFVWMDGRDLVIVGNFVGDTKGEHCLRSSSTRTDRVLIAHNDLSAPTSAANKGGMTVALRRGRFFYVTANHMRRGRVGAPGKEWGFDETSGQGNGYHRRQWIVLERNRIEDLVTIANASTHIMHRNNILSPTQPGVDSRWETDPVVNNNYYPRTEDVHLLNNTVMISGTSGRFMTVSTGMAPQSFELRNNLMVAPNLPLGTNWANGVMIKSGTTTGFSGVSHNIWPNQGQPNKLHFIGSQSNNQGWLSLAAWSNTVDAFEDRQINIPLLNGNFQAPAAATAEACVGVHDDFNGVLRQGTWKAGAVQQ